MPSRTYPWWHSAADELGAPDDLDALRSAAVTHLQALQGKLLPNQDTGWELTVTRQDIKKLARDYAQRPEELQALAGIEQMIRHAVLAETHPDTKGRDVVESVARFYAPVKIGGRLYRANSL
ncbi:MAG: hypothetical protein H0T87_01710 [Gammaproteobacteria bacterium]|nr:hypothetical protein [Gammaproteobacteria bacterium]